MKNEGCGCFGALAAIGVIALIGYSVGSHDTSISTSTSTPDNMHVSHLPTPSSYTPPSFTSPPATGIEYEESFGSLSPDDAYDEGYDIGYEHGYEDAQYGYGEGYSFDDSNDYDDYYDLKYCEGYEDGYGDGYEDGSSE